MASSAGELEGAFASLQLGAGHPPPPARGRGAGGGSAQGVAPHVLAVPRSAAARGAASTAPSFRSVPSAVFGGGFDTSSSSSVDGGSSVGAAAPPTGRAAPASGRHNVGRIPELDYFARKLARKDSPEWKLPHGKAGDVAPGGLPDVHASQAAYLSAMQAHAALEFQAAAASAVASAEGKHPLPEQKWWPFEKAAKGSAWVARPVPGRQPAALDFSDDGDPWGKHLVHVRGADSYHVVRKAWRDPSSRDDILVLLPTVEGGGGGQGGTVHMRSLGYLGSFLLAYASAQTLRHQLRTGVMLPGARLCLELAADPRRQLAGGGSGGTLRRGPLRLLSAVPANAGQRAAVAGVGGGLSVIHGPPGTGKSTTIFHIVEGRVQPKAQVVVTATRNQAIDAVVSKLSRVEGEMLVFGREERLGDNARRYLLKERVKRHPHVAAWLDAAQQLQALRGGGGKVKDARVAAVLSAALAQPNSAPEDQRQKLRSLLDKLLRSAYTALIDHILQPALNRILAAILPLVKRAVERSILQSTRVYACTVDTTPGMVSELEEYGVQVSIDTVIVDEAGCVAEMVLPTLIRLAPSQLVLVGDHLQLPAFTDLQQPPGNHTRSLMERAVQLNVPAAMLSVSYRMHPDICSAISQEFYGGGLVTAPEVAARRAVPQPCRFVHVPKSSEQHHPGGGYSNKEEARRALKAALTAAAELRGIGVRHPTVYLVSLYNMQRYLLSRELQRSSEGAALRAAASCQVLSVDACQGAEADAVIVSTVRAQGHLSSFFRDRRRINVALSRARHLSIVCGYRDVLALPKAQPWGRVLAGYSGMAPA